MLISEELHLLLTRSDGKDESSAWGARAYAEVAAVIIDLVRAGRIEITDEKRPRVRIVSAEPTGHPVLDGTLDRLAAHDGDRLDGLTQRSKLDPRALLVDSLVAQRILERGGRGLFGMGAERTPEADPHPEARLRARLAAVIAGTAAPTPADAALLALLQAMNAAPSILRDERGGLSAGPLKKRIEEIAQSVPAADAVSQAVSAAAMTLMMSAVVIPAVVAGT